MHKNFKNQPAALWYHSNALISLESSSSQYTAISVEWEPTAPRAHAAFKCQVATAESRRLNDARASRHLGMSSH